MPCLLCPFKIHFEEKENQTLSSYCSYKCQYAASDTDVITVELMVEIRTYICCSARIWASPVLILPSKIYLEIMYFVCFRSIDMNVS